MYSLSLLILTYFGFFAPTYLSDRIDDSAIEMLLHLQDISLY